MRNSGIVLTCTATLLLSVAIFKTIRNYNNGSSSAVTVPLEKEDEEEHEGYDDALARYQLEFEKIKDPSLGYVPMSRMFQAVDYTENLKQRRAKSRVAAALNWTERGPNFDVVGPSNGNTRAGNGYTAGRMKAVLIDTLNDPTGNTVFVGGVAGGLWKCTNFLSTIPNWQPINDRFDNIAISFLAQDPTNAAVMYFSTGEGASPSAAVYGGGVWKSVDAGATWQKLSSSTGFIRTFKLVCDASGNIYLANRNSTSPASAASPASGLYRSKDGGNTWQNITPNPIFSTNSICTDIEISTTGTLHASFGYSPSSTTNKIVHFYTTNPAGVTTTTWSKSTGIRLSGAAAVRLELATSGNVVYGITVNSSNTLDSTYKSVDGGATFTKQNTALPSGNILGGQGWIHITLAINPDNSAEIVVGGLDAYKSTNSGATFPTRMTYWWGATAPYVHADHMNMQWWKVGTESRMFIATDGGLFYSTNGGAAFADKNRNLSIKQFYDGALHPDAGSNYMIAGSQDNGVHQLNGPGLTNSVEVTGGDGAFVHINQQNPQIQFGSYVYNEYRRSVNGGATWSTVTFSTSVGLFINPFDYDDARNNMYASYGSNTILRWLNANTSNSFNTLTLPGLGTPTTFKVSPYTSDRLFVGSNTGKLYRLDKASTTTTADLSVNLTDITGATFPATGYMSCVNTGSSDDFLVATFSSYGVGHVWYSSNGGTSWTRIDGNLPDMPVRWAVFDPQSNNRLFIATEAGVYSTDAIDGTNTAWVSDEGFPTVRTDMLQVRPSDNTLMATTFGRGIFTAVIPAQPEVRFTSPFQIMSEAAPGAVGCRTGKDYIVNVAITGAPNGDATVSYILDAGSSAREGIDFDYTTNGSFTSASKEHVFASGTAGIKTITVRIYDDQEIEPEEFLKLRVVVGGATNAIAGAYTSYQATIQDNDFMPVLPVAPNDYLVGTTPFTINLSAGTAFRSNFAKHRVQFLYKASELTALGIVAGDISALTTRVITKNSTKPFSGYTISLGNTSVTNLASNFVSGLTQVYTSDYTSVVGNNTFEFGTGSGSEASFRWDGISNLVVQFCFDNTPNTADAAADNMEGSNPFGTGTAASNYATIYSNATTAPTGSGCALQASNISNSRINASFKIGINGNPVETMVNSSKTNSYGMGTGEVPFYNSNGKIIAILQSLTPFDYGCTQVIIDRAGTSASSFIDTVPSQKIMDKTFRILPATNNPNGVNKITLFFTPAEKAGWEAATGMLWNDIKLIKVKGRIADYTPSNQAVDGANAIEVVTPIFGMFGSDYTLSFTFSSGFSGLGAGLAPTCTNPGFNTMPVSKTVCQGDPVTLTADTYGATTFYQWRKEGVAINGATAATYTIPSVSPADTGIYDVVISGVCAGSSTTSSNVSVNLHTPVSITTQPLTQAVCEGASATFSVSASGTGISYQWRKDGVNITGATTAAYTVATANATTIGSYDVIVTGTCGSPVISNAVALTMPLATSITTQPAVQVACIGGSATFSVAAVGTNLTYQWRKAGNAIVGATTASYTIASVSLADASVYDVVVTGTCGVQISTGAALTINTVPAITSAPVAQTVCVNNSATLAVTATGTGLTYQWKKGSVDIAGATGTSYTISNTTAADDGIYTVLVSGVCPSPVTSTGVRLTVNTPPVITAQPQNRATCVGNAITFDVTATGTNLAYQWRKDGVNIIGATTAAYTVATANAATEGSYDVIVTGTCGTITSSPATLTANAITSITAQPIPQAICVGWNASFDVAAVGNNLSYQWRKDGNPIIGATGSSYAILNAGTANAGSYTVAVTGGCGALTSAAAVLTVNTAGNCTNLNANITSVQLLPNRVQQQTTIRVKADKAMNIEWRVTDDQGKTVMLFRQSVTQGINQYTLTVSGLAAGNYYLTGRTPEGGTGVIKFIKF
jgi:hypothetical protein